jgi:hypothetical protein
MRPIGTEQKVIRIRIKYRKRTGGKKVKDTSKYNVACFAITLKEIKLTRPGDF